MSIAAVAPEAPRRRKELKKVNISGPKRRWVDKDPPATHEECWLDTPIDVDDDAGDALTATWPESDNEASKPRSRSPRGRKPKPNPSKDEDGSLLESAPGWCIKDAGAPAIADSVPLLRDSRRIRTKLLLPNS